jgi:glycosyltransferase involved in cell wall biosynthesis
VTAPELTVLMPAYNEAENLPTTLPAVWAAAEAQARSFEILVVDDGSTDRTADIVREFGASRPNVRLIQHPQNLGPGSGVKTGIREAYGEFIIFIPADIAIDLTELHRYLAYARAGADVVVGLRSDRRDYSVYRKVNSFGYIALVKVLYGMPQRQFNYVHLYRRAIFDRIEVEYSGVFITAEILIKARDIGCAIAEVEIGYVPRVAGTASCGRPQVIAKTARELFHFWPRWVWGRLRRRPAGVRLS